MTLDVEGNIIVCAGWETSGPGPMIYVFSPTGRILETHPLQVSRPTNCCFGDADMRTLYVTTGPGHLLRARTDHTGWIMWP
jgi:gluconolactonase